MNEIPSLGQVAFEAYCAAVGGKTFDGKPIPGWDELHGDRLKVQGGWEAAAQAVRQHTQMMAALDQVAALPRAVRQATQAMEDMREAVRQSRWQPLADPVPVGELEPEFSAPIGRGEAPTGEPVDVEAQPDSDVECDDPGCTRRHHH